MSLIIGKDVVHDEIKRHNKIVWKEDFPLAFMLWIAPVFNRLWCSITEHWFDSRKSIYPFQEKGTFSVTPIDIYYYVLP